MACAPAASLRTVAFAGLLTAAVLAVYLNALHGPFLFDDHVNIVRNGFLRIDQLTPDTAAHVWNAPHPSRRRKLSNFTFALNYLGCGLEPHCYRLVNIGIHAFSALLAFAFFSQALDVEWLRNRFGSRRFWIAWGAAALWALHPINLNAVTYIVQRMTSLAGMFGLLSLNCWLLARRTNRWCPRAFGWGAAAFFFWGVGILAKENLILLPLMALATEALLFRRGVFRLPWRFFIWFGLAIAAWMVLVDQGRVWQVFDLYAEKDFTLVERLLTQARVLWHYVSLFLAPLPDRFALLYDFPISRGVLRPPSTLFALTGWVLILGLAIRNRRKRPLFSWTVFWFLVGHLLESTILPLEIIYEHRNYLPSLSLSLGIVLAGAFGMERLTLDRRLQAGLLACVLLAVGSATGIRNQDYRDVFTFYKREIEKFPDFPRLRLNLAIAYQRAGRYEEGFQLLRALVRDYPDDVTILQNWYVFWSSVVEDPERADAVLGRILRLITSHRYDPKTDAPAIRNLARRLKQIGRHQTAIGLWEMLLETYPGMDSIWFQRGLSFMELGEWEAARDSFETAWSLNPGDPAIGYRYGQSLLRTGAMEKGCDLLRRTAMDSVRQNIAQQSQKLYQEQCGDLNSPF